MFALGASPDVPTDPAALADEIARTAAHLDSATHRLLTCIRAFDESGEWERQGAISCAHWLTWRISLDPGTAREKVRVARALGHLPHLDEALRRGSLSYAKTRALTRVATAENEERLLEMAQATTGAQLERLCRQFRRVTKQIEGDDRPDDRRYVRQEVLENGMVRLSAVLHPDEAALVMKAVEHARRSADTSAETPAPRPIPPPDALVRVAESYLAHGDASGHGGERTQLFLHVDQDPLAADGTLAATLDDGTRVSSETLRRLACDASVVPVLHAPDGTMELGRRTRTISPALRRALWLRDRGCRFPACPNHLYLHAHHVHHWAHGGATSAENLVLLCSRHHRLVHEAGFAVEFGVDGLPVFRDQKGRMVAETPPIEADEGGLSWMDRPTVEPEFPGWTGEGVDYDSAIEALLSARAA